MTALLLPLFAAICWILFLFSMVARYVDKDIRFQVRTLYNIEGGGLRDSLAAFCCYPQAVWQTYIQVTEVVPPAPAKESTPAPAQEGDAVPPAPAKETASEPAQVGSANPDEML